MARCNCRLRTKPSLRYRSIAGRFELNTCRNEVSARDAMKRASALISSAASPCPRQDGWTHTALISVKPSSRMRSPAIATSIVGTNIKSSNLIVRSLAVTRHWLLASPALIARCGAPRGPDCLKTLPSVGGIFPVKNGARHLWRLEGPRGQRRTIAYRPRLVSEDLFVLKEAVLAGCGIADLPPTLFKNEIADGRLIRLVPKWELPEVSIYALYPSREGLPLAVRMLVDDLMANLDRWNRSLTVNSIQIKAPKERIGVVRR
jgi:LysR substrate binding domain